MNPIRHILTLAIAFYAFALTTLAESPDVSAALADRSKYPEADWPNLYYLTTRPHVGQAAKDLERALTLTIASTSRQRILQRCVPVEVSQGLYRINLADLHWRQEDWFEIATKRNPYTHDNASPLVIRGDWFLQEITDQQESDSYLRLLFGGDAIPKTIDDVRKAFDVDSKPEYRFGMIAGQSSVNKVGIRWLESRPVARGYYWQTFDALKLDQNRDPIEHPGGDFAFDGSEVIIGMPKLFIGTKETPGQWGVLQCYFLTNGKNEIVARAPVDLVEDSTEFRGYREIRNSGSCIQCHATGLNIPGPNEFRELLLSGVTPYLDFKDKENLDAFHLGDVVPSMQRSNDEFQTMVTLACGPFEKDEKPTVVAEGFKRSIDRYDAALTLEQVASEMEIEPKAFAKALTDSGVLKTARLRSLLAVGGKIPRESFEQHYLSLYDATHGGPPINVSGIKPKVIEDQPPPPAVEKPEPKKPAPRPSTQPQQFGGRGRR